MSDALAQRLERAFGAEHVAVGRARFDEPAVPLLAPSSAEAFREALALARAEGWRVAPLGLGSKLGWCAPPAHVDFLVSTRAFAGVVAYEPGDGTLTARAGTTLAELAARAASGGHAVTPDVPRPARASLGGVIAAGQSGADRLRYGPVRDHVLGVEVALADGTRARSGGRLVKNVTGYDLQRLFTGSHGTLCVILEATLRLFPLPEAHALAELEAADATELGARANAVLALPAACLALTAERGCEAREPWRLSAHLGGRREVLDWEQGELERAWPGARRLRDDAALERARAIRDRGFGEDDDVLLRVQVRPSALAPALAMLEQLVSREPVLRPRWRLEPGIARIELALGPVQGVEAAVLRLVHAARGALSDPGASVTLLQAPRELAAASSPPSPAGADVMRAIRSRLDPTGVFAAGRLHAAV